MLLNFSRNNNSYAVIEKLKCTMEEIEASITTFKRKHSDEYGASH